MPDSSLFYAQALRHSFDHARVENKYIPTIHENEGAAKAEIVFLPVFQESQERPEWYQGLHQHFTEFSDSLYQVLNVNEHDGFHNIVHTRSWQEYDSTLVRPMYHIRVHITTSELTESEMKFYIPYLEYPGYTRAQPSLLLFLRVGNMSEGEKELVRSDPDLAYRFLQISTNDFFDRQKHKPAILRLLNRVGDWIHRVTYSAVYELSQNTEAADVEALEHAMQLTHLDERYTAFSALNSSEEYQGHIQPPGLFFITKAHAELLLEAVTNLP